MTYHFFCFNLPVFVKVFMFISDLECKGEAEIFLTLLGVNSIRETLLREFIEIKMW